MLVGRDEHLGRVLGFVSAVSHGRGGALVLRGEAGVGKTTLLDAVAVEAAGSAATVLRTRGMDAEHELAFAGLHDLCRPILHLLDELSVHQRDVLAGALALGPPAAGDRFSVGVAALSLLTAAAARGPVVAVVDDIHWVDGPTAETLVFVARRAGSMPLALMLGWRDTEPPLVELDGIPELVVEPLDPEASRTLLVELCGRGLHPETATRLIAAGAGNPLALRELAELHRRGMLRVHLGPVPPAAGITVGSVYARRARALPPRCRDAIGVAAASAMGFMNEIADALESLGLGPDDLVPAVGDGLARIEGGRVVFVHPLARAAIYHSLDVEERRRAHLALAGAIGRERAQERRAWHLAAATLLPDESVAAELELTGRAALERGGAAAAAHAFEEAARLSESPESAAPRLVLAAEACMAVVRGERAAQLADDVLAVSADPVLRARAHQLRARALGRTGRRGVIDTVMEEAERVAESSPELAAAMFVDAAVVALSRVHGARSLRAAVAADRLAAPLGGRLYDMANVALGAAYVLDGRIDEGLERVRTYQALLEHGMNDEEVLGLLNVTAMALVWAEEFDECRVLLERAVAAAREHSMLGTLPNLLLTVALLDFGPGDWGVARGALEEAADLAEQTGQGGIVAAALTRLALIEAFQGREEACLACVDRVHVALGREPARFARATLASAVAQLHLTFGRPDAAIAVLEPFRVGGGGANPVAGGWWETYLVEAYVRIGRPGDAVELLDGFEVRARAGGNRRAIAAAMRCRGMLAEDLDEAERCFAEASTLVAKPCVHWPWALAQLLWGMRLRDAGRTQDADLHLGAAANQFDLVGALPMAEQARAALSSTAGPRCEPEVSGLAVRVLGGVAVVNDGDTVALTGHPARALAFVALHGRPAHVDEVVEALWPEAPPGRGRVRLRNVLSRLRQAAGGDVVIRRGELVELAPGVEVDATRFERDARAVLGASRADPRELLDRGTEVAALYTAELAPELLYEEWCEAARSRLIYRYIELLDLLAECAEQLDDVLHASILRDRAATADPGGWVIDLRDPTLRPT